MKANVVESPTKVIAGTLGLAGFVVAAIAGLAIGNDPMVVIGRAIIAMLVCNIVGYAVGRAAQHTVSEYLDIFKRDNPVPTKPQELDRLETLARAESERQQEKMRGAQDEGESVDVLDAA